MRQPAEYTKLWRDINRELWRAAVNGLPPRALVRAELWRRVDHTKLLEKSAAIKMAHKKKPTCAIFKVCCWLVESGAFTPNGCSLPTQSASAPPNAAIPQVRPQSYLGVMLSQEEVQAQKHEEKDHYETFVHAFIFAAQAAQNVGLNPQDIEFEFDFSKNRWIVEGTRTAPFQRIRVNFLYLHATPKVWNALFEAIVHNHHDSRKMAERYVQSVDAQQLLTIYCDISPLRTYDVYDLSEMFDQINAQYFDNAIPRPMLAWTTRANYRTLGTYNFHWDLICISKLMNDRRVPKIAVEFVLYHEMLHIKHGLHNVGGRSISHTPAFRADEMKFNGWQEAVEIHKNLRRLVNTKSSKSSKSS